MYHLLPFRFERINNHEIIVNEVGDYLIVPLHTVHKIVHKQIAKDEDLYKNLIASFFISESPVPELIDVLSVRLRTKKAFLDQFTSLHIFVLTLRCNQNCVYCQASSKGRYLDRFDMDKKDLYASIVLMFKSPTRHITMEFQGGESSLVPELLEFAIETSILLNNDYQKKITYVLCTNVISLTERVLNLCVQNPGHSGHHHRFIPDSATG
jgi:sulfatase maturation enzyme AslB (radical SAM superfamily)